MLFRSGSVGRSARSLVTGLVRVHISTRLVRSQGISVATVIGFIAATDTGSFFFVDCLHDCTIPTTPPLHYSLFTVPSTRTFCLDHAGSYLRDYKSLPPPH